jgi:subtilisin family serine protease
MERSRSDSVQAKLDPALRILLAKREAGRRVSAPAARGTTAGAAASVLLSYSGDLEPLRTIGFRPHTIGRGVATGVVELDCITALASHPHVVRIKLAQRARPLLDKSVPAIHVDAVRQVPLEARGEGVIVGVVDAGIDFRHPCFLQPDDQSSRILFLWDQTLDAEDFEDPPTAEGFDYGVEYDRQDIDETIEGFPTCRHVEEKESGGHGTHIAGVAAGDGSVAGNCRGTDTFVGVAPDADLIAVRYDRTETGLLDAISYVFLKAAARGQAAVVNVSQGDPLGPHDGTTEADELLDNLLDVPGRAIVFSAGNNGDKDIHVQDTLTPSSVDPQTLEFVVEPETDGSVEIDLWYPGTENLTVGVQAPGSTTEVPAVAVGSGDTALLGFLGLTTTGTIDHEFNIRNLDHHVVIELERDTGDEVERGTWRIILHGTVSAPTTYHGWITNWGSTGGVKFVTPQVEASGTLNGYATGTRVITVGAFATEGERKGHLASFSSLGPTRDGRRKPDLVAPGVAITSARAKASVEDTCCCDCCVDMYVNKDGTSFAAPHVAGIVALMLEQNAGLTIEQIRAGLIDTADAPTGITPLPVLPNSDWGAGIVNALDAVNGATHRVAPPPPIGGGSDGIRRAPVIIAGRRGALDALRRRALATPGGQLYAALVSRHFSEIRGLINTDRRVATVWHRLGGPLLVRRLVREAAGRGPAHAQRDAMPSGPHLARFLAAVARRASPALRSDLARYGNAFAAFIAAGPIERPRA